MSTEQGTTGDASPLLAELRDTVAGLDEADKRERLFTGDEVAHVLSLLDAERTAHAQQRAAFDAAALLLHDQSVTLTAERSAHEATRRELAELQFRMKGLEK